MQSPVLFVLLFIPHTQNTPYKYLRNTHELIKLSSFNQSPITYITTRDSSIWPIFRPDSIKGAWMHLMGRAKPCPNDPVGQESKPLCDDWLAWLSVTFMDARGRAEKGEKKSRPRWHGKWCFQLFRRWQVTVRFPSGEKHQLRLKER